MQVIYDADYYPHYWRIINIIFFEIKSLMFKNITVLIAAGN
jgi:hypothetical protein